MLSAQDYSAFGSGRGLNGPTVVFLILFIKSIKQSLPHILIHENVMNFPIDVIIDLLAGAKLICVLVVTFISQLFQHSKISVQIYFQLCS